QPRPPTHRPSAIPKCVCIADLDTHRPTPPANTQALRHPEMRYIADIDAHSQPDRKWQPLDLFAMSVSFLLGSRGLVGVKGRSSGASAGGSKRKTSVHLPASNECLRNQVARYWRPRAVRRLSRSLPVSNRLAASRPSQNWPEFVVPVIRSVVCCRVVSRLPS